MQSQKWVTVGLLVALQTCQDRGFACIALLFYMQVLQNINTVCRSCPRPSSQPLRLPTIRGEQLYVASVLFVFCIFTHYTEISVVGLVRLLDVRIRKETLLWLRVENVMWISK